MIEHRPDRTMPAYDQVIMNPIKSVVDLTEYDSDAAHRMMESAKAKFEQKISLYLVDNKLPILRSEFVNYDSINLPN